MSDNVYVRFLNGPLQWLGIVVGLAVVTALLPTMVNSTWVAILFGALVIVATLACIVMRVKIVVSDDGVTASVLGLFSKTISLKDITGVSVGPETGLIEGAGPRVVDGSRPISFPGPPCVSSKEPPLLSPQPRTQRRLLQTFRRALRVRLRRKGC